MSDGTLTSTADPVVITAKDTGNIAPIANAGPDQKVKTGNLAQLDSITSDANGDALTYFWRFQSVPMGGTTTFSDSVGPIAKFTPDIEGFYVVSLFVTDSQGASSPVDTVVIEARLPSFVNSVLQAYVKASNSEGGDLFGGSVALSGDTLAVGAIGEDSCADGIGGDETNNDCSAGLGPFSTGAVYVFTRTGGVWSQQAYVKASNSEGLDGFGHSVALSGDTLAVGASLEASCADGIGGDQADNTCFHAGAVYVYAPQ